MRHKLDYLTDALDDDAIPILTVREARRGIKAISGPGDDSNHAPWLVEKYQPKETDSYADEVSD